MIVVMANGNVAQQAAPGHSREGLTRPVMMLPNTMDGVYERSFGDIVEFVENRYRVIREKSSRAIAGLSMGGLDRKSTRLNSSHVAISYAVFCLKKKKNNDVRKRLSKNMITELR